MDMYELHLIALKLCVGSCSVPPLCTCVLLCVELWKGVPPLSGKSHFLASHAFLDEHYLNASLYFEGWRGKAVLWLKETSPGLWLLFLLDCSAIYLFFTAVRYSGSEMVKRKGCGF